MSDYDKIKSAIAANAAIQATYKGIARKFVPFVLGTNPSVVLGYQYDAPAANGTGWRCFPLADFQAGTVTQIAFVAPAGWTPKKMKFKDVKRQNCVENVEVWQQNTI